MSDPAVSAEGPSPNPSTPHFGARLRRIFLTGLVILAPVALTIYILLALFRFMDAIFAPVVDHSLAYFFPGLHIPGLGILLTLIAIFLLGWLSTNVLGRRAIQAFESLVARIPVAKSIYGATKGVLEALAHDQSEAFKRVVLVEYPKSRVYAVAFVTNSARWRTLKADTDDLLLVFVPTTPNPTSGFLLLVPRSEAIDLPISVEAGVRLVISGGLLLPKVPAGTTPQPMPAAEAPSASTSS